MRRVVNRWAYWLYQKTCRTWESFDDRDARLRVLCYAVQEEVIRACGKHPTPIHSLHEGHSIIREEFDEFWDEVKAQKPDAEAIKMELIQTAAMCVRTLLEVPLR